MSINMGKDRENAPVNDKGQIHGLWECSCMGMKWFDAYYINGQQVGYEEYYDGDGELKSKSFFIK